MELEHLSHDHPLILLKTEHMEDEGEEVCCYGCALPISIGNEFSYYGCNKCWYFLHKSCAQLPQQITHPFHSDHPLSLLFNPPGIQVCEVCEAYCSRFIYRCSECDFDLDMKCASMLCGMQQKIEHTGHSSHPLTPLQKPAIFSCDACGKKHEEGVSYLCTTCGFWVNQKCANSLPTTIKLDSHYHHHPLTLIYSIPQKYYQLGARCKICNDLVERRNWVYYCSDSECLYFAHVNCVTSEIEHSRNCNKLNSEIARDCKLEINKAANVISLPVPDDDSVDLITQLFIKGMRVEEAKYKKATEMMMRHASHEHPLIFCDNRIDHNNNSKLNDAKCNGCAQSIISPSTPFYHCAQCNFLLHEWCAELPDKLRHPFHPQHPLLLATDFHIFGCRCCGLYCNSFKYGCSACNFFVDSKCASLPRIIRHEAHNHILALRPTRSDQCSACGSYCELAFVCDPCNINLCVLCALLPSTVRHRYDEQHPFILTYSPPFKDWTEGDNYEDFCEICLRDINPKFWFYHCEICDQSLHTSCIRPTDEHSHVNYGVRLNTEQHPHPLAYVRTPKNKSPCGFCGEQYWEYRLPPLECMTCNFWVHYYCVI